MARRSPGTANTCSDWPSSSLFRRCSARRSEHAPDALERGGKQAALRAEIEAQETGGAEIAAVRQADPRSFDWNALQVRLAALGALC